MNILHIKYFRIWWTWPEIILTDFRWFFFSLKRPVLRIVSMEGLLAVIYSIFNNRKYQPACCLLRLRTVESEMQETAPNEPNNTSIFIHRTVRSLECQHNTKSVYSTNPISTSGVSDEQIAEWDLNDFIRYIHQIFFLSFTSSFANLDMTKKYVDSVSVSITM